MPLDKIIASWKDAEARESLSDAERAVLPANPAGDVELDVAQLDRVAGGEPPPQDPPH
jgi:mersacidin/lichenicidin family type 2 lantibiotic